MKRSVRPTEQETEETVENYSDMLFRLCMVLLGNRADAEDAVSDTFLKYIQYTGEFHEEEHKKAWLLRVATNVCKDIQRFRIRHTHINLDDLRDYCADETESGILADLVSLRQKYKEVLMLYYLYGYKTEEIAEMLRVSPACVRKRLQYARDQLKLEYERGCEYEPGQFTGHCESN